VLKLAEAAQPAMRSADFAASWREVIDRIDPGLTDGQQAHDCRHRCEGILNAIPELAERRIAGEFSVAADLAAVVAGGQNIGASWRCVALSGRPSGAATSSWLPAHSLNVDTKAGLSSKGWCFLRRNLCGSEYSRTHHGDGRQLAFAQNPTGVIRGTVSDLINRVAGRQ
jgi:hypothetical protein